MKTLLLPAVLTGCLSVSAFATDLIAPLPDPVGVVDPGEIDPPIAVEPPAVEPPVLPGPGAAATPAIPAIFHCTESVAQEIFTSPAEGEGEYRRERDRRSYYLIGDLNALGQAGADLFGFLVEYTTESGVRIFWVSRWAADQTFEAPAGRGILQLVEGAREEMIDEEGDGITERRIVSLENFNGSARTQRIRSAGIEIEAADRMQGDFRVCEMGNEAEKCDLIVAGSDLRIGEVRCSLRMDRRLTERAHDPADELLTATELATDPITGEVTTTTAGTLEFALAIVRAELIRKGYIEVLTETPQPKAVAK